MEAMIWRKKKNIPREGGDENLTWFRGTMGDGGREDGQEVTLYHPLKRGVGSSRSIINV
jgi:hypothetical protein